MVFEKLVLGPMQVNCYIIGCARIKEGVVVDPGAQPERVKSALERHGLKLSYIVNTHGHVDHIEGNSALGAPIYIHQDDAEFLTDPERNLSAMLGKPVVSVPAARLLKDGDRLEIGGEAFKVIHTPGHTPGGICLCCDKFCLTGDTLFAQGVGRTDFPYGDEVKLYDSIRRKLFSLEPSLKIYPGHGPDSTIGEEKEWLM